MYYGIVVGYNPDENINWEAIRCKMERLLITIEVIDEVNHLVPMSS